MGEKYKNKRKNLSGRSKSRYSAKWLYEQDTYGNGKPLFTIDQNSPNGVARNRDANGKLVPTNQDDFSYAERKSALNAAGLSSQLLVDTLKKETTWANVQKTQPAPSPPPAPVKPETGPQPPGESEAEQPTAPFNNELFQDLTDKFVDPDEKTKYDAWGLKYPIDMDDGQDRIFITQIQYIPGLNVSGETNTQSAISGESRFRDDNSKKKIIGNVILPMPNDISESNSVGWGDIS